MRHRIQRPWWQRLWMRLSKEQQLKIRSYSLSMSVNISVLLILGLCAFSLPHSEAITLTLGPGDGREVTEDTITIEPQPEEEELPEPDVQDIEPAAMEAPDQADEEAPPDNDGEPMDPDSGQMAADPSQLAELDSDAARISEIERRVASAGGGLHGPIRVSLGFSGNDDIDLHLHYEVRGTRSRSAPARGHVFYRFPRSYWGSLDVDANARSISKYPAENIIFARAPSRGSYQVQLHHYRRRGPAAPTPYVVVVKYGHLKKVFSGNIMPGELLDIYRFTYRHRT